MKKLIVVIFSLSLSSRIVYSSAQVPDSSATIIEWLDYVYDQLDTSSYLYTGILWDKGLLDTSYLIHQGLAGDSVSFRDEWYEIYRSLQISGYSSLPPLDSVYKTAGYYVEQGYIPLLGLHVEYDHLVPHAMDSGLIDTSDFQYYITGQGNPFETKELFSIAPVRHFVYTDTLHFIFPESLHFSNIGDELLGIEIRMQDGEWIPVEFDDPFDITDWEPGEEASPVIPFNVRFLYSGYSRTARFRIKIVPGTGGALGQIEFFYDGEIGTNLLTADLAISGSSPAKGYAAITFGKDGSGNKHTCFTKPLIIVEGIDFGTRENPAGCVNGKCGTLGFVDIIFGENPDYPQFKYGPQFVGALVDAGYDLIYLDFYDGATYMEDNAMVLVKLIQHINQYKCTNEEIVVCGASMGGQVAKFALSYMEDHGINHCVRTYVSFDSPHKGANIPLGLQQFTNYTSEISALAKWNLEGKIRRPATKQLLIYHIDGTWSNSHAQRDDFLTKLNAIGNYPALPRKVAVINGSATMQDMGFNAGDKLMDWHSETKLWFISLLKIDVDIYALCGHNDVTMRADIVQKSEKKEGPPAPACTAIDHVPGGYRSDFKDLSGQQYLYDFEIGTFRFFPLGYVTAYYDKECFIPSISSLDVNAEGNYFTNINAVLNPRDEPNPELYPFEAYYAPNNNEMHVELTFDENEPEDPDRSNIAWLVNELESTRTGISLGSLSGSFNFGVVNQNRLPGLVIQNGGLVQINGNYFTGFGSGTAPAPGSHFVAYKRGCDETVEVEDGGSLIVGDANTPSNNTGDLYFPSGTNLILEDGSTLRIHNGSRLIIEAGATLFYHSGATILLDGPEAVLEIRGDLKIVSGTFTFSHSGGFSGGYIHFDLSSPGSGISTTGSASRFELNGANTPVSTDKVLEITGGVLYTPDAVSSPSHYLAEFVITGGLIAIGENAGIAPSVPSEFSECIFNGLSITNSFGLSLDDPSLCEINECSFRNLSTGLYLDLDGMSPSPTLSLCSFKDNDRGLHTVHGGISLSNCHFTGNNRGWHAQDLEAPSEVTQCVFTGNEFGVYAGSGGNTSVFMEETSFGSNGYGILVLDDEDIALTLSCCRFRFHAEAGLMMHGILNMSTTKAIDGNYGGNNAFYNNALAVQVHGELYLDEGQNLFIHTGAYSSNLFFTGILEACSTCGYLNGSWELLSAENYWVPDYNSLLDVNTSPNPTSVGFTGTPHGTFTSACFSDAGGGNPEFIDSWDEPQYKNESPLGLKLHDIEQLNLYPNPADGIVYLEGQLTQACVFDLHGKQVGCFEHGDDNWSFNSHPLAPGVYTVRIYTGNGPINIKLVVNH